MNSLTQNWLLRVLSLVVATVLFLFVRAQENEIDRSYNVPIAVNVPAGQLRLQPPRDATALVVVSGPAELVEGLQIADITVEADVSGIRPGRPADAPLQVQIDRPARDQQRLTWNLPKKSILVHLDIEAETTMTVSTEFDGGVPTDWALVGAPEIEPPEVRISGPESAVQRVARVVASIQLQQEESNQDVITLRPVDEGGAAVGGVVLDPPQTQVSVQLQFRQTVLRKRLPVQLNWRGLPPTSRIRSITLEPPTVVLHGSADSLRNLHFIETQPVTITTAPGTFTATVRIQRPEGIDSLVPASIRVTVVSEEVRPEPSSNTPGPPSG